MTSYSASDICWGSFTSFFEPGQIICGCFASLPRHKAMEVGTKGCRPILLAPVLPATAGVRRLLRLAAEELPPQIETFLVGIIGAAFAWHRAAPADALTTCKKLIGIACRRLASRMPLPHEAIEMGVKGCSPGLLAPVLRVGCVAHASTCR